VNTRIRSFESARVGVAVLPRLSLLDCPSFSSCLLSLAPLPACLSAYLPSHCLPSFLSRLTSFLPCVRSSFLPSPSFDLLPSSFPLFLPSYFPSHTLLPPLTFLPSWPTFLPPFLLSVTFLPSFLPSFLRVYVYNM
jgi:hypothetical protein